MSVAILKTDSNQDILSEAKRVLRLELEALTALCDSLGTDFTRAIEIISTLKGRVIVTGMGKSGHIANKIAATLASTGTPAFFIHPAEASHGDLGMISPEDCILALSNSGETRELSDLIHYANRFKIPLIAMTSNGESALAKAAQAQLILPKMEEACSLNLVPTTSTTMMIALGDALAVTLLKIQGFTSTDFGQFHPGGKLGQRLMFVEKFMHASEELPIVPLGTPMGDAVPIMTHKKLGCIGVVNEKGALDGVITDGDLRRHLSNTIMDLDVDEVMTKNPEVTYPNALAVEALALMNEKKITNLFVVESPDNRKPIGVIHVHDCLKAGMA